MFGTALAAVQVDRRRSQPEQRPHLLRAVRRRHRLPRQGRASSTRRSIRSASACSSRSTCRRATSKKFLGEGQVTLRPELIVDKEFGYSRRFRWRSTSARSSARRRTRSPTSARRSPATPTSTAAWPTSAQPSTMLGAGRARRRGCGTGQTRSLGTQFTYGLGCRYARRAAEVRPRRRSVRLRRRHRQRRRPARSRGCWRPRSTSRASRTSRSAAARASCRSRSPAA